MSTANVTKVRVLATRIPLDVRPRLARLAKRGFEVCRQHGAKLQSEAFYALGVALVDLAATELRAEGAEARARRAERDLAEARRLVAALERDIADRELAGFAAEVPTRVQGSNLLLEVCK